jgi:hypothetical protein
MLANSLQMQKKWITILPQPNAACAGKTLTRFASIQPTLIAIWQ